MTQERVELLPLPHWSYFKGNHKVAEVDQQGTPLTLKIDFFNKTVESLFLIKQFCDGSPGQKLACSCSISLQHFT